MRKFFLEAFIQIVGLSIVCYFLAHYSFELWQKVAFFMFFSLSNNIHIRIKYEDRNFFSQEIRRSTDNFRIFLALILILTNIWDNSDDTFKVSAFIFFVQLASTNIASSYSISRYDFFNKWQVIIIKFDFKCNNDIFDYITTAKMIMSFKSDSRYVFQLLAWPYNGVQFYFRKKDENLWELIAPKIIAEGFIKDLEKYSGELLEVIEVSDIVK